jgi:hypothetical protein
MVVIHRNKISNNHDFWPIKAEMLLTYRSLIGEWGRPLTNLKIGDQFRPNPQSYTEGRCS